MSTNYPVSFSFISYYPEIPRSLKAKFCSVWACSKKGAEDLTLALSHGLAHSVKLEGRVTKTLSKIPELPVTAKPRPIPPGPTPPYNS